MDSACVVHVLPSPLLFILRYSLPLPVISLLLCKTNLYRISITVFIAGLNTIPHQKHLMNDLADNAHLKTVSY